jgi:hypothetical protein
MQLIDEMIDLAVDDKTPLAVLLPHWAQRYNQKPYFEVRVGASGRTGLGR